MDKINDKPPWKNIIFFRTKSIDLKDIKYCIFETNIPKALLEKKEEINVFEEEHKWELAKKLANPYEMVYTQEEKFPYPNISLIKPLSRSYFKLVEILQSINFFGELSKDVHYLRSAHVAEGPGGFIQAFIDISENQRKKIKKIDAITLKSDKQFIPGWKKAYNFLKKYNDIIKINYGKDDTGDIYIKENRDAFILEIQQKVHLFTADGGFDFSIDYSQQEKHIFKLLVSSFIICFQVLTINGYCVIKLFDTYSPSTKTLISICGSMFKEYTLYKPVTSRPCNSERYFIGKKFKGFNNSIINILNNILLNCNTDINIPLYPIMEINIEEKNYIESIEKIYEVQQIECINLAKSMAENNNNYKKYYEKYYNMSYNFCKEFKIPTKNLPV